MRSAPRIGLFLLLALSFILNLVPLWWGLPGYPTWAPDELMPGDVLDLGQWPPKYPPLHRYLLSALYRPLDSLFEVAPAADGWLHRLGRLQTAGRILSVVMGTALVYLVYRYGRLVFDRRTSLLGAAIVAFSPSFVYYSKTVNLEIPYLFWFGVSLFFLLAACRRGRLRDHLLFGIAAALAVGTKDQAYGLYLASPVILIWGHMRREEVRLTAGSLGRFLGDRRLWAAVASGAVTLALVHRLPFDWDGFMRHFETVTGGKTMAYQLYERSVAGQWRMFWRAVGNFGFGLGWPWLIALGAGVGLGLKDSERRWFIASVAALAATYYLGFISVIGFHYVRFFLPLVILTAPLAAWGLLRSLERLAWRRLGPPMVALLLLISLGRAISVDVAMANDSRYRVEEFVNSGAVDPALALGRRNMLPRGVATAAWGGLVMEGCGFFAPELNGLVVNATDLRGDLERERFARLAAGDFGFDEVLRHPAKPGVRGLWLAGVDSNLRFVNPDVRVLARGERPCLDQNTLPEYLTAMRGDRRRRRRIAVPTGAATEEVLVDAMRGGRLTVRVDGDAPPVLVANLRYDGWTYGAQTAAALVGNQGEARVAPLLQLECWASRRDLPVRAHVDDGHSRQTVRFNRPGRRILRLQPLDPGESALILLWSDKAWQGRGTDARPLGVKFGGIQFTAGSQGQ